MIRSRRSRTPAPLLILMPLLLVACGDGKDGLIVDPTPPAPADLVLSLIRFSPVPPAPDSLGDPDSGWPEVGSEVTWEAVVVNRGEVDAEAVPFRWVVDGIEVASGMADFEPGENRVLLPRPWSAQREQIGFVFDGRPMDLSADSLTVASNALSVGLRLEKPVWDHIDGRVPGGVEAWARREVDAWNGTLASYSSAAIPQGVLDRLRLDIVEQVPAGTGWPALPSTDLFWYFRSGSDPRFAQPASTQDQILDQTIVLHELLHQRGLADIYAYEILAGNQGSGMDILDPDGSRAAGTERLPYPNDGAFHIVVPATFSSSLMGSGYRRPTYMHDVSVWGLNLNAGRRTPRFADQFGNARNALAWRNQYLNRMPETVRLQVRTSDGPIAGATVDIFPDRGEHDYADYYAEYPELSLAADSLGWVSFPGAAIAPRPVEGIGSIAATAIVRVIDGEKWDYQPLPLFFLSQRMAAGDSILAEHSLRVNPR